MSTSLRTIMMLITVIYLLTNFTQLQYLPIISLRHPRCLLYPVRWLLMKWPGVVHPLSEASLIHRLLMLPHHRANCFLITFFKWSSSSRSWPPVQCGTLVNWKEMGRSSIIFITVSYDDLVVVFIMHQHFWGCFHLEEPNSVLLKLLKGRFVLFIYFLVKLSTALKYYWICVEV